MAAVPWVHRLPSAPLNGCARYCCAVLCIVISIGIFHVNFVLHILFLFDENHKLYNHDLSFCVFNRAYEHAYKLMENVFCPRYTNLILIDNGYICYIAEELIQTYHFTKAISV